MHNNVFINKIRNVWDVLLSPIKSSLYIYLFLLNTISNFAELVYDRSLFAAVSMVLLATFSAYVESLIYKILYCRWIKIAWIITLVVCHNILIIIDGFLVCQFHMAIGQDVIDILSETNIVEIDNFLKTYLSFGTIVVCLLCLLALNYCAIFLADKLKKLPYIWPSLLATFAGMCILFFCIYSFAVYRNGMSIPQYQTSTRIGYSVYTVCQRYNKIEILKDFCRNVKAYSLFENKPTIVVIIGESFSLYHSSLYGYSKETNPLLQKRNSDGQLQLFNDAVTTSCLTHGAMLSVFSLDSLGVDFERNPLFPVCFKAAGWKTYLFDNQYFVGSGVNFLSNSELSSILFDERNKERFDFDMDMVERIQPDNTPSLYVIHLWGQHYTYSQRYPNRFKHFVASDYDSNRWNKKQREIIAHYDNATRYNDYVVDQIIKRFENTNSCVVYFSDHGEEIYDQSDYVGHGNAYKQSNLSYQIRVPFMVWTSSSFSREDIKEKIKNSCQLPLITDDVPHLLLDIAGIKCDYFRPSHSVINPLYNINKPRLVLHSIDYDNYKAKHNQHPSPNY